MLRSLWHLHQASRPLLCPWPFKSLPWWQPRPPLIAATVPRDVPKGKSRRTIVTVLMRDDPDDTIQLSHSLALQHLAALSNPSCQWASDNHWQRQTQALGLTRLILLTAATAPIPLNHPWNLPAPAPPTTPCTTRRQTLATRLGESLRWNFSASVLSKWARLNYYEICVTRTDVHRPTRIRITRARNTISRPMAAVDRAMITQHACLIYQRIPTITLPLFVLHLILLSSSY